MIVRVYGADSNATRNKKSIMFYVASDLHLEFYSGIEPIAGKIDREIHDTDIKDRVIFLCGDIGNPFHQTYSDFMKFCSSNFRYVVIIAGNHEYYNIDDTQRTMTETDDQIEMLSYSHSNVFFLNGGYCILKEFKMIVLGATLWSKVLVNQKGINDFNYIVTDESHRTNSNLTIKEYRQMHLSQLEDLTDKVVEISQIRERDEYSDYRLIVMTHHLPSYSLISEQFKDSMSNQFFATDLDYLFEMFNANSTTKIDYWFCGHTHTRTVEEKCGTKIVVNPYGYPNEYDHTDMLVLHVVE